MDFFHHFLDQCENRTDKLALVINEQTYTYGQLHSLVRDMAYALEQRGAKSGDHLALVLGNSVEFVTALFAAAALEMVVVPFNHSLAAETLLNNFERTDVRHLAGWHSVVAKVRALDESRWGDGACFAVGGDVDGCLSMGCLDEAPDDYQLDGRQYQAEAPFILTMTSGSTGSPKPIILSRQTKLIRAKGAQEEYGVNVDDVVLAATPLYHSLAERLVILPLIIGATAVVMPAFSSQGWIDVVNKNNVTFTIAVSSQLSQILNTLKESGASIDSLRCVVSSSALLDTPIKKELVEHLKAEFHECYGASEVGVVTNLSYLDSLNKMSSVGTPVGGVKVKILDPERNEVPVNEKGEIACETKFAFSGYYKRPEKYAEAMHDGYFLTGDIGSVDEDGFLSYAGRLKDLIVTGGINVYPQDIEEIIKGHESVAEVAVIPLPDEQLGEIVVAVVVAEEGKELTIRDIQWLCAKRLADFQQPRQVHIVLELPKNPMGKVMKHVLVKQMSDSQ